MGDMLSKIDPLTLRTVMGAIGGFVIFMLIFGRSAHPDPNGKTPGRAGIDNFGDFAAYLGLLLGCAFWCIFWFGIFKPDHVQGWTSVAMSILSLLFGVAQPTALPWLIAKTFPRETFALHIHKKTVETDAFKIQLVTTAMMSIVSFLMAWGWLGGALGVANPIDRTFIAIMFVALATMVPSFAMLQIIPKSWKLQLEVEELIEKKERLRIAEEMLIEAHLVQAIIQMSLDPLQMAADQRKENDRQVAEILGSVLVRVNEGNRTMMRLAAMLVRNQNLRLTTPDDREIYEKMYKLFEIVRDKGSYQLEDTQATLDMRDVTPPEEAQAQFDRAKREYETANEQHQSHLPRRNRTHGR